VLLVEGAAVPAARHGAACLMDSIVLTEGGGLLARRRSHVALRGQWTGGAELSIPCDLEGSTAQPSGHVIDVCLPTWSCW
jgi:hypothetical protein